MSIPFREDEELNSQLRLGSDMTTQVLTRVDNPSLTSLPGNAFLELGSGDIHPYLTNTLLTADLDYMAPRLWLAATYSGSSISSLSEQAILGRQTIPTESAKLHLLWYHNTVFIKPLPEYLLSHAFWSLYLSGITLTKNTVGVADADADAERERLRRATVGFIRSYAYLIRSECDFQIALKHGLLPPTTNVEHLAKFLRRFSEMPDDAVSSRYHYGELRLSRLNLWSGILLGRMEYFDLSRQYETYFSRYFQTLIFAFAAISVVLGSMQVGVAVVALPSELGGGQSSWTAFCRVCKWTAVVTLVVVTLITLYLCGLFLYKTAKELSFALNAVWRRRYRKRHGV